MNGHTGGSYAKFIIFLNFFVGEVTLTTLTNKRKFLEFIVTKDATLIRFIDDIFYITWIPSVIILYGLSDNEINTVFFNKTLSFLYIIVTLIVNFLLYKNTKHSNKL